MQFNKSEVLLLLEDAMKAGFSVAEPYLERHTGELATAKETLDKNIALLRGCWNIILGPDQKPVYRTPYPINYTTID